MNSDNSFFKAVKALIWLTQLGISIAVPIFICVFGSVWLRDRYQFGDWILAVGIVLGLFGAADGLVTSLKAMGLLDTKKKKPDETQIPAGFDEHE